MTENKNHFSIMIKNQTVGEMLSNISYSTYNDTDQIPFIKKELEFISNLIDKNDVEWFGDYEVGFDGLVMEALVETGLHSVANLKFDNHLAFHNCLDENQHAFKGRVFVFKNDPEEGGTTFSILEPNDNGEYEDLSLNEFSKKHNIELLAKKILNVSNIMIDMPKVSFNGDFGGYLSSISEEKEITLNIGDSLDKSKYIKKMESVLKKSIKGVDLREYDYEDNLYIKEFKNGDKIHIAVDQYIDNPKGVKDLAVEYSYLEIEGEKYGLHPGVDIDEDWTFINSKILKSLGKMDKELNLKEKNNLK
jgi:hypothetical protein